MLITDLPRDKHYRFFEAAYFAAFFASGIGGRKNNTFRLGTTLVQRKQIIAVRNNDGKTHPKLLKFTDFPFKHSESSAILSAGMDNCENAILYVVRILRNNQLALSKPCQSCIKLIKVVGIKKVYFTTGLGYEKLELI